MVIKFSHSNVILSRPSDVSASVTKSEKKSLALKLSGTLNRNNSGKYVIEKKC